MQSKQIRSKDREVCLNVIFVGGFQNFTEMQNKEFAGNQYNFFNQMKNDEDIFDSFLFTEQQKINEMEIKKLSGKNEANNASPCPRCGGDRYNIDKQVRSGDEARSFYIKCGSCGLTETE